MSVSYWQDRCGGPGGCDIQIESDIVIIGAGLAGLSAAWWLNKLDSSLTIYILDKGTVGSGASGRNAGFITCGSTEHFSRMLSAYGENKAEEIWKFTEYNHRLILDKFGKEVLERDCQYRNKGSWTLASTDHEVGVIKSTVSLLQGRGVNVEWKDSIFEGAEGFLGGAYYSDDGEIHPLRWLWKMFFDCDNSRVNLLENREVFEIEEDNNGLLINATSAKIKTQAIVLCTNAWAGELFSWLGDKIAPTRGQIIVTEPVGQFMEPSYCSFVLDYFRQLVDGSVLIGGFRNADVEKEVGLTDEINPLIHSKLENFLHTHFPLLRKKRITHRWSGVMGFAVDGYPMVGSLPEDPRIFYNVGFTAHGLGFTFATGELVAKLILEGQDPGIFSGRRLH